MFLKQATLRRIDSLEMNDSNFVECCGKNVTDVALINHEIMKQYSTRLSTAQFRDRPKPENNPKNKSIDCQEKE